MIERLIAPGAQSMRAVVLALVAVLTISGTSVLAAAAPEQESVEITIEQPTRISERIAQALDDDPEAIFRFVADHVRYEPYSGVLRGAAGTYYSRAGNSPDQALLLARLLNAAGLETRFAVGAIDDATTEALVASGIDDPAQHQERLAQAIFGRLPGDTEPVPALPSAAEYAPVYAPEEQAAVSDWTTEGVVDTVGTISAALGEAGIPSAAGFTVMPADERSLHTWIQLQSDGTWIDLDPSLPGTAFGDRLTDVAETADTIAAERQHRIEIGMISERIVDGQLIEEELLTLDGTAVELAGTPIVITNVGSDAAPQLSRAFEAVLGVETLHPVIVVGTSTNAGAGMLFKEAGDGGGLGGGFFDTGPKGEETTAQWVELRVLSPGREPVHARRIVFDLIGVDARATGTFDVADVPPLEASDLDGDGELHLAPEQWVTWLDISTGVPSLRASVVGQEEDAIGALANVPFAHHLLTELSAAEIAAELGVRPFVDAPNVSALTAKVVNGDDGTAVAEGAIDIWHRSHGVVPIAGVDASGPPAMLPGVLAHVTERLMTGAATSGSAETQPRSVGAVFEAAAAQDIPLLVISSEDDVAQLALSAEAAARMRESIMAGRSVVVPERPVGVAGEERAGWWLVDPATGRITDEMDDGRGISATGKLVIKVVGGLLATVTISGLISLIRNEMEGSLWEFVNKKLSEDVKF